MKPDVAAGARKPPQPRVVTPAPRVMIAGTGSGCGKTTVTVGILRALARRGCNPGAFKCGPDYIDPMYHRRAAGGRSTNLDLFFFSENTVNALLAKNAAGRPVSILEGVMGFYDGIGQTSQGSSYALANATQSPVVLVLNARGVALSILAVLQGFLQFQADNTIRGVILNGCGSAVYQMLAPEIRRRWPDRVLPLGYLPELPHCRLERRHLGLVPAAEAADLEQTLDHLAEQTERSVDLDGLLALAASAPPVAHTPVDLPPRREPVRVGVARDRAFCFYYPDSLEILSEMGAELVFFSPLDSAALPPDLHGIYLGGGYPELYAERLSQNRPFLSSLRAALGRGVPCIAECGGFMYLTEAIDAYPMAGVLPGRCADTGKLTRFGYVRLRAKRDNLLCPAGGEIPAHEFHHWDCTHTGGDFSAEKRSGRRWDAVVATDRLYAGFPHFHFYANPAFAERFYLACLAEKHAGAIQGHAKEGMTYGDAGDADDAGGD